MMARWSHKPQIGRFKSCSCAQFFTEHSLIRQSIRLIIERVKVQILLFRPTSNGVQFNGKTIGLYPILAADYRKITGSSPVAPRFLLQRKKSYLNKRGRSEREDKRMLKIPVFLFAMNTFVFCLSKRFTKRPRLPTFFLGKTIIFYGGGFCLKESIRHIANQNRRK